MQKPDFAITAHTFSIFPDFPYNKLGSLSFYFQDVHMTCKIQVSSVLFYHDLID